MITMILANQGTRRPTIVAFAVFASGDFYLCPLRVDSSVFQYVASAA